MTSPDDRRFDTYIHSVGLIPGQASRAGRLCLIVPEYNGRAVQNRRVNCSDRVKHTQSRM